MLSLTKLAQQVSCQLRRELDRLMDLPVTTFTELANLLLPNVRIVAVVHGEDEHWAYIDHTPAYKYIYTNRDWPTEQSKDFQEHNHLAPIALWQYQSPLRQQAPQLEDGKIIDAVPIGGSQVLRFLELLRHLSHLLVGLGELCQAGGPERRGEHLFRT